MNMEFVAPGERSVEGQQSPAAAINLGATSGRVMIASSVAGRVELEANMVTDEAHVVGFANETGMR